MTPLLDRFDPLQAGGIAAGALLAGLRGALGTISPDSSSTCCVSSIKLPLICCSACRMLQPRPQFTMANESPCAWRMWLTWLFSRANNRATVVRTRRTLEDAASLPSAPW